MSFWDSPIIIGIIGFIGGIFGGVIVNIISINYQKRIEKKIEAEKSEIEYTDSLKALLNEIVETWEKELTKDYINQERIQNVFDIYSMQLTSLIARGPHNVSPDLMPKLRDLSFTLSNLKNFIICCGPESYQNFISDAEKSVNSAKEILGALK